MQGSHISWTPLEDLQQWSHTLAPPNERKPPHANETERPRSAVSPETERPRSAVSPETERPRSAVSPDMTYVPADVETTDRKPKRKHKKRSIFLIILTVSIILGLMAAVVAESRSRREKEPPPPSPTPTPSPPPPRPTYNGTATFNDYAVQGNTVCGPKTANVTGYFGAAAGDISPNISGGQCSGSINMSFCTNINPSLLSPNSSNNIHNTTTPYPGYNGPECPRTNCGLCFRVTTTGYLGANIASTGRNITVQIIDSCPSTNALNYCKANAPYSVPANERCGDASTNQLDIDTVGYEALTGQNWTSNSPNLIIDITPVEC